MARTALQSMRHRRRRWIALWTAFALLFNQIALAQHLCLWTSGTMPAALVGSAADGSADCHSGTHAAFALTDIDATACAAHCDDGDKQTRDGQPLKVPDLAADWSEIAQLRPLLFALDGARPLAEPPPVHARRTTELCVLLI